MHNVELIKTSILVMLVLSVTKTWVSQNNQTNKVPSKIRFMYS